MEERRAEMPAMRIGVPLVLLLGILAPGSAIASGGLVLMPDFTMLFVLLCGFVLLVAPINALIFRPIFRVLDERHQKIEGARDRAQLIDEEASRAMARYRASVREARDEAESGRQFQLQDARCEQGSITSRAKQESDREVAHARSDLAASLEEARATLRTASEGLARQAAERILGRTLQ